jgi:hypothetical protein
MTGVSVGGSVGQYQVTMVVRTASTRLRTRDISGKHAGAIKDILTSHPKVVKIRYQGITVITIRHAWGK